MIIKKAALYTVLKFLKYKLFSSHGRGHGIHSPFVYNLVVNVFRNKIDPGIVLNIERTRMKMLKDHRIIEVNDLGAGSVHMKGSKRKISDVARYSPVSRKYGILLASLASEFGDSGIIELGTSLGISSMYLASGCPGTVVRTIEGCSSTASAAEGFVAGSGISNIRIFKGSFENVLPEIRSEGFTPGLVFIDGDHRGESLRKYYSLLTEFTGDRSVVIIDDISSSPGMGDAWEWIRSDPRVSITIDIYRMGMVFFRKGMTKTDYIIRY